MNLFYFNTKVKKRENKDSSDIVQIFKQKPIPHRKVTSKLVSVDDTTFYACT